MAASAPVQYEIRWRETGTLQWSKVATASVTAELVVTGLDRSKNYDFEVRAVSACGAKSVWVPSGYSVPNSSAPPAVATLAAQSVSDGVLLTWTTSTTPPAGVEYEVWRSDTMAGVYALLNRARTLSYTDGITDGVVRWYKVRAINFAGVAGAYSPIVSGRGKTSADGADVTGQQTGINVGNPYFQKDLSSWTPDHTPGWYWETGTGNKPDPSFNTYVVHAGSTALAGSTATDNLRNSYHINVRPGQQVVATCCVKAIGAPNAGALAYARISWRDINNAEISTSAPDGSTAYPRCGAAGTGTYTQCVTKVVAQAPTNAVYAVCELVVVSHTGGYFTFCGATINIQPSSLDEVPDSSVYTRSIQSSVAEVVDNADFEASTSTTAPVPGWSGGSANLSYAGGGAAYAGNQSLGVTTTAMFGAAVSNRIYTCSPNDVFLISGAMVNWINTGPAYIQLVFFDKTGAVAGTGGPSTTSTSWNTYSQQVTAPANSVNFKIYLQNNGAAGSQAAYDGIRLSRLRSLATEVKGTLSTQRNLPTVSFGNYGSGWIGLSFGYNTTPTVATITATAATLQFGNDQISYNASAVGVTGSAGATVKFYLYYDDPNLVGGSQTLQATTSNITAMANNNRLLLGTATVVFPTSGTGGGSGGGACVTVDSWLPGHGAAGAIAVDDLLELVEDAASFRRRAGRVTYAVRKLAPCVRIITESGISLDCSTSAPILCSDESLVLAPDLVDTRHPERNRVIPVSDFGDHRHERVVAVEDIGEREVMHITCENSVFLAGRTRGRYIGHHNLKPT